MHLLSEFRICLKRLSMFVLLLACILSSNAVALKNVNILFNSSHFLIFLINIACFNLLFNRLGE
jgi:hypothetical protein